jgi:hypothetical protein
MDKIEDLKVLTAIKKELNSRFDQVNHMKRSFSKGKLTRENYQQNRARGG